MTRARHEKRILILGSNDIGSATAHRLFMAGYSVVLHESPLPASTRRRMSFTDAVFDGFLVGETVDIAVETAWGEVLGDVIREGGTRALFGEPREIDGHGRDRYVYTPVAGEFRSTHRIREMVQVCQEIAWIDATPLLAPITGIVRGLTHTHTFQCLREPKSSRSTHALVTPK